MADFFTIPPKIVSGEGALEISGETLAQMGTKAFIVTDKMMQKLGNISKLTKVLDNHGVSHVIFDEINSEPKDVMISDGLNAYKKGNCDFFIALGGGSPIDAMKAISMLTTLGGVPADYFGAVVSQKLAPMVAIPTTAGTGSEATQFTIITDVKTEVKMLLKGPALLPDLAIIDPAFTITAPAGVTAATGLDALCHCIEAFISIKAQPLSDTFAMSAAKRIFDNLRIAYNEPNNVKARTQMSLAATEAGIAFNNSSVTLIHGMSRPIGALFPVPHGLSNAMLMKVCFNFVAENASERFAELARYCGLATENESDKSATQKLIYEIEELLSDLKIQSPAQFGISKDKFMQAIPKMAEDALKSGSPANTPCPVDKDDLIDLYKKLWI